MVDILRCKHCGITENLLKSSKFVNKSGGVRQYYMCRPCNNTKHKRYNKSLRGKQNIRQARIRTNEKHPDKLMARKAITLAVKTGRLPKSNSCEVCGVEGRIEGHHMDYTKPLEVIWLCSSCHTSYHKA